MLRKFAPACAIAIFVLSVLLAGCNGNGQNNGGGGTNQGVPFDTARAARSVIPIDQAIAFQKSFINTRAELGKLLKDTSFLTKNFNLPNGEAFTKDALLLLLSQKGADGVRIFYGKDSNGVVRLVLLPVDKDGKVIYTKLITSSTPKPRADTAGVPRARQMNVDTDDEAVETGQTCPPCLIDPQQN